MRKSILLAATTIVMICICGMFQGIHSQSATPVESRVSDGKSNLVNAYKKEFAFLENERISLENRIGEIENDHNSRVSAMEAEIETLEKKLLSLTAKVDVSMDLLRSSEEKTDIIEESSEIVDSTISQAMMTLEKYGVTDYNIGGDDPDQKINKIGYVFSNAVSRLGESGKFRIEQSTFFVADGTETTGDIIHIGNIAAFGVSDKGSGTLAPAGNGALRLWNNETADTARGIKNGQSPPILSTYIFESLDKMVQKAGKKTVHELIKSGGVIAYVIVVLGLFALFMLMVRTFFLWRSATDTSKLVDRVTPLVENSKPEEALLECGKTKGAASRVLAATIRHLDMEPNKLEDIISESILHETPYLERFESAIMVFAAVAPLLGLLGTVTGMISTFDVITEYGTGDPKLLSGGISEALVTTQLGLMVAIPALLLGNLLSGWSERIKSGMEKVALRVMNVSKGYRRVDAVGQQIQKV